MLHTCRAARRRRYCAGRLLAEAASSPRPPTLPPVVAATTAGSGSRRGDLTARASRSRRSRKEGGFTPRRDGFTGGRGGFTAAAEADGGKDGVFRGAEAKAAPPLFGRAAQGTPPLVSALSQRQDRHIRRHRKVIKLRIS
eukprot:298450-Prorocentrum_minimum.AAC.1